MHSKLTTTRWKNGCYIVLHHQPSTPAAPPPLPCMTGRSVEIHLEDGGIPRAVHTAAAEVIHWPEQVLSDLNRDEALGVIERILYGEPVYWCHCMVVTRKHNGTSRRTVDLSHQNKHCRRETFPTESPFHLARRVPKGHGKHSGMPRTDIIASPCQSGRHPTHNLHHSVRTMEIHEGASMLPFLG